MASGGRVNPQIPERTALVLGGGGLKGFAHIGVLRPLEERARTLRRRDLLRINHLGMLLERMRSPALYLEEPLRQLCSEIAPAGTFRDLPMPLLVNTVDIERGTQVVWGL